MENKPWYASKTIWGVALAGIGLIAAHWGVLIAPDDATLNGVIEIACKVAEVVGLVLALYGRIKAQSAIGKPTA